MRLILILGLAGAIFCIPMSAFGQSKIEAVAEAELKVENAFPFIEKQITGVGWEYGEGGEFFSEVIKDHEYPWMCDYSCTMTAELAEDAFYFVDTINEGLIDERYVYAAEVIATVKQEGNYWGDMQNCDFEEENSETFILKVEDYTTEGWLDFMWLVEPTDWELWTPWPPCFIGPLLTEVAQ